MNTLQKLAYRPKLDLPLPPVTAPEIDLNQITPDKLSLCDSIRLKSAELWLRLDQPELASRELESLSSGARVHPWSLRVHLLIWSALYFK